MTRLLSLAIVIAALSGCAHKDLKAPCKNIAAFSAGEVPCDQRKPVNDANTPSVFAEQD